MYHPLPSSLTIKPSKVNGLGLFATEEIERGSNLGICHLQIGKELFRTPLGGFINHSDNPNCTKSMARIVDELEITKDYKIWRLFTLNDIKPKEELTLTYTFYKICK